jgi:hypothetical protein
MWTMTKNSGSGTKESRLRESSDTWEGNGLALVFGGALSLMAVFLALTTVGSLTWVPYVGLAVSILPAGVLVLIGWVGLYEAHKPQIGYLGFVGFVTAFFGAVVAINVVYGTSIEAIAAWDATDFYGADAPRLMRHGLTLWFAILLLGLTVFGFSMFKAKVYPRGAAVMLMIGSVLLILVEVMFVFLPTALIEIPANVVVVGAIVLVAALFRLGFEISSGLLYRFWKWLPKPHSRHRSRHEG